MQTDYEIFRFARWDACSHWVAFTHAGTRKHLGETKAPTLGEPMGKVTAIIGGWRFLWNQIVPLKIHTNYPFLTRRGAARCHLGPNLDPNDPLGAPLGRPWGAILGLWGPFWFPNGVRVPSKCWAKSNSMHGVEIEPPKMQPQTPKWSNGATSVKLNRTILILI